MKKGVRCTLTIFTLLAGAYHAPAAITHYVGTPVELNIPEDDPFAPPAAWYLDGAAETIELGDFLLGFLASVRDPDNPDPDDTVTRERAFFPWSSDDSLRFIADDSNRRQVARLPAGTTLDASAPLVQLDRFFDYPPVFRQYDPIVTFADGMWGNFEANASASGYFAFRFDLNADGDSLTEQRQYGWARISFSEIIETDADDDEFSIIIHEWGWANIGDTDFRIGAQPAPPLSIARGSTGGVDLFWSGTSTVYQLQHKDDLITTNWIDTPESAVLDGITNTVNTPTSADLRFYRLTE